MKIDTTIVNSLGEYMDGIVISDPQRIAYELLSNGMNDSWLYPELPIVSNVLSGRKVY